MFLFFQILWYQLFINKSSVYPKIWGFVEFLHLYWINNNVDRAVMVYFAYIRLFTRFRKTQLSNLKVLKCNRIMLLLGESLKKYKQDWSHFGELYP